MGEEGEPIRRRWWQKKRFLIPLGILLFLVMVRLIWGLQSAGPLRKEVDAILARGEPLRLAQLAPEPIPDDENAAELYKKAGQSARVKENEFEERLSAEALAADGTEIYGMPELLADRALRRKYAKEVEKFLSDCEEVLALARRARPLKKSDWKVDYSVPAILVELPPLAEQRSLARVLCLAALAAHDAGDDAGAMEYLRDTLALGRAVRQEPFLISYLVSLATDALAFATIEEIAPALRVGVQGTGVPTAHIREFIGELLQGEQALHESVVRTFMAERCWIYETFEDLRHGRLSVESLRQLDPSGPPPGAGALARVVLAVVQPLLVANEARALRHMSGYVEAAKEKTYAAAVRIMPEYESPTSTLKRITHVLSSMLIPTLDRLFALRFRSVATWRMTAIALAVRLYQLDHAGRRPKELAELVPEYLPTMPTDPFATEPRPFGYLPEAAKPLLYSVHEGGKDDGGRYVLSDGAVKTDESPDQVFFLDGDRPRAKLQPTTVSTRPAR